MEWFELIKEYEAKHGSFDNASYNDDDYILFRFEMIKEEFGVDGAEALKMMLEQVKNANGSRLAQYRDWETIYKIGRAHV